MPCPNCRKDIPDGAAECGHCGVIVAKFLARASRPAEAGPAPAAPAAAAAPRDWTLPAIGGSLALLLAALARCGREAARKPSYARPFYEVPLARFTNWAFDHARWFVLFAALGLFVVPFVERLFKDDPAVGSACRLTRRIARWPGILATAASLAFWLRAWGPNDNDQLFVFWFPGMILVSFLFGVVVWGLARLAVLPFTLISRR